MDLKRLSMSFIYPSEDQDIQYLLQNTKLLEKLHLSIGFGRCLLELYNILSPNARTLKVFDLKVALCNSHIPQLAGICKELETMKGRNVLEALSIEVQVGHYWGHTEDFLGYTFQKAEKVLVKPGWPALRQFANALQSLQ